MKALSRALLWAAAAITLLATSPARAGMIGIPTARVGLGSVEQGFVYDFSERNVKSSLADYRTTVTSQRLLLRAAFGVTDRLDIALQFWSGKASTANRSFEGFYGQAYGFGFKRAVGVYRGADLGVGGQLFALTTPDSLRQRVLDWTEYEIFFGGVGRRNTPFVPYGGLVYSGLLTSKFSELNPPNREGQIVDDQPVGLFVGGEYRAWQRLAILAEFRIVHERAFTFAVTYRL